MVGATDGRLESGASVRVTNDLPLTLAVAPSYVEVDALAEDARGALRATVRVGLATDPASYLVEVPWEAARLRAEVLIAAFLDDIRAAYARDPALASLLVDPFFGQAVADRQAAWRDVVALVRFDGERGGRAREELPKEKKTHSPSFSFIVFELENKNRPSNRASLPRE